jgi:hypothetical protein
LPVFGDPFFPIIGSTQLPIDSSRGVGIIPEVDSQKVSLLE